MKKILVLNNKGGCGKSTLTLALAQVLGGQIVDLDPQKTLTHAAEFTRNFKPIVPEEVSSSFLIYDTPPYRDASLGGLLKNVDLILIPVLVGYPDLLATKPIADQIIKLKMAKKSWLLFNKVRKPYNKSYFEIKTFFEKNYPEIKFAKQEISELKAFQDILAKPLKSGKGTEEIKKLIKEVINTL